MNEVLAAQTFGVGEVAPSRRKAGRKGFVGDRADRNGHEHRQVDRARRPAVPCARTCGAALPCASGAFRLDGLLRVRSRVTRQRWSSGHLVTGKVASHRAENDEDRKGKHQEHKGHRSRRLVGICFVQPEDPGSMRPLS